MRNPFKTYLALFAGLLAVPVIITMAFNWQVDPYRLYHPIGPDEQAAGIGPYTRITKPYMAGALGPRILLAGSSRAEYALSPDAAEKALGISPAFNAALSGANIYELRRMADHVNAVGDVDVMILGLDFYMFNAARGNQTSFNEARLAVAVEGGANPLWRLADIGRALLSVDAVDASRRKLKYQSKDGPCEDEWNAEGYRRPAFYECETATNAGFRRNAAATLHAYQTDAQLYENYRLHPEGLAQVAHLLQQARAQGQRVILYISPVHALHLAAIKKVGLWPEFENWKRALLQEVEEARARGADAMLWDFARLNELTSIPLPSENVEPWNGPFYDSHHIRPEMGNRMLRQILGAEEAPSWGVRLTAGNAEEELARQKAALAAWLAAHPEEAAFLEKTSR